MWLNLAELKHSPSVVNADTCQQEYITACLIDKAIVG